MSVSSKALILGIVATTTFSLSAAPVLASATTEAPAFGNVAAVDTESSGQSFETVAVSPTEPEMSILELTEAAHNPHSFDVAATIAAAEAEVGTSRATGWSQPGECLPSARRWVMAGGGVWDGGSDPVSAYTGALRLTVADAKPGDVLQYEHIESPTSWVSGVHTLLITAVNDDGTFSIVESNNPGGSGLVTRSDNWTPAPPAGFQAVIWRF